VDIHRYLADNLLFAQFSTTMDQWREALESACRSGPIAAERVIKELKQSDTCLEVNIVDADVTKLRNCV